MNNFPLKTTDRYKYLTEKHHEKFPTDTPNGRRLSFENWLKSVISLKLAYFMKIQ